MNNNNLQEILKQSIQGAPSPEVSDHWQEIQAKMKINRFWKPSLRNIYSYLRINVITIGLATITGLGAYGIFYQESEKQENSPDEYVIRTNAGNFGVQDFKITIPLSDSLPKTKKKHPKKQKEIKQKKQTIKDTISSNPITPPKLTETKKLNANNIINHKLSINPDTLYIDMRNKKESKETETVPSPVNEIPSNYHIAFPDAFTPNGDGINDHIMLRGRDIEKIIFFRIYNRWGDLLYETKQINEGWDGRKDGEIQPSGDYVYHYKIITPNNKEIEKQGIFKLLK